MFHSNELQLIPYESAGQFPPDRGLGLVRLPSFVVRKTALICR